VFKADATPDPERYLPADADDSGTDDYLEDWGAPPAIEDLEELMNPSRRVVVQDSAGWCGGPNDQRQVVRDPLGGVTITGGHPGVSYSYEIELEATVEKENNNFDFVSLRIDDNCLEPLEPSNAPWENNWYFMCGLECGQLCVMKVGARETRRISLDSRATVTLEYDTVDERFHKGAYAIVPEGQTIEYIGAHQDGPRP